MELVCASSDDRLVYNNNRMIMNVIGVLTGNKNNNDSDGDDDDSNDTGMI